MKVSIDPLSAVLSFYLNGEAQLKYVTKKHAWQIRLLNRRSEKNDGYLGKVSNEEWDAFFYLSKEIDEILKVMDSCAPLLKAVICDELTQVKKDLIDIIPVGNGCTILSPKDRETLRKAASFVTVVRGKSDISGRGRQPPLVA